MNTPNQTTDAAATLVELQVLAGFCSSREWDRLITSESFLSKLEGPRSELEAYISTALGRKISATAPSAKNSGDETL